MKKRIQQLIIALAWLALPLLAQAQFTCTTNNGAITITSYTGAGGAVAIPATINGYPVTSIGELAFSGNTLTSVTIPGSVTNIGESAFEDCDNLTKITVKTSNPDYSSLGGVLLDKAQATLIQFPGGLGDNYIIPSTVTSIGNQAFDGCFKLTTITIPKSVTSIAQDAFQFCGGLTNITVNVLNVDYSSLKGVLFDKAQATLIYFPGGLGGNYVIPSTVTSIREHSFQGCFSLSNVTILQSVTNIGEDVFGVCFHLTNLTVSASNPNYSSLGGALFDKTWTTLIQFPDGPVGNYVIPSSVTSIGVYAFDTCALSTVTIPNSVTNIGEYAFNLCENLTNVNIGSGLTSIGEDAFSGCNLTSVTIPNSVTSIGTGAFQFCSELTNVTIPNSVTNIGDFAFDYCGMTKVAIPDSVTSIGAGAFDSCPKLTSVTIPNSVTSIGYFAFYSCDNLTSVTIRSSVTSIEPDAFAECTNLSTAYFLGNAPYDYASAFLSDPATVYYLAGTTGWGSTFGGVPAVFWNPQAVTPGFTGGQFGFNLTGPANAVILVEACTNLYNPVWLPIATNAFSVNGTSTFSDPQSANYPGKFYRFKSP